LREKPIELVFFIEPSRIDGFIMDIRDASLNLKDKKDFHKLLADSAEEQAKRQMKKCKCDNCECGKEKAVTERLKSNFKPLPLAPVYETNINPQPRFR